MKTKALISFAVTVKLICVFVFAYAKKRFSHNDLSSFYFFLIIVFCFVVALFDLVHDVEAIFPLP